MKYWRKCFNYDLVRKLCIELWGKVVDMGENFYIYVKNNFFNKNIIEKDMKRVFDMVWR